MPTPVRPYKRQTPIFENSDFQRIFNHNYKIIQQRALENQRRSVLHELSTPQVVSSESLEYYLKFLGYNHFYCFILVTLYTFLHNLLAFFKLNLTVKVMVQLDNNGNRHLMAVSTPTNNIGRTYPANANWQILIDNQNINLQKAAHNRFKYIPPNGERTWVVPYRLRDNTPCPSTTRNGVIVNRHTGYGPPRNREQLARYTLEQWYVLSEHYEFNMHIAPYMDIGECRAIWAVFCGANIGLGRLIESQDQELQYRPTPYEPRPAPPVPLPTALAAAAAAKIAFAAATAAAAAAPAAAPGGN